MAPVQLYIYDLSNGLAKQLSAQLTGRQIDGIWHTSIVVYGKEVFYGQGISTTLPGRSHHGQPLQVVPLGETAIDEATWEEYLQDLKDHYTARRSVRSVKYFNCNSFTNDCAGFLTGGSIPAFVKGQFPAYLPTDFLSTPFGAALRPTIDNMYRRPSPGVPAVAPPPPNQPVAASLLQAVAAQAQAPPSNLPPAAAPLAATESLAGALHPVTNSASFRTLLRTHRAVVALFTDFQGCPPCRMIAPVYEQLAAEKGVRAATGGRGAAFTKIDIRVGAGGTLATEWGIRATPTFMFFLDEKKIAEVKGADVGELKSQIDLLLFQAYPPHPHSSLSLTGVKAISLEPILFTQVPPLDNAMAKFVSFIDAARPSPATTQAKEVLTSITLLLTQWTAATSTLVGRARDALAQPTQDKGTRNYVLTTLRLLANVFKTPALARTLLCGDGLALGILVPSLLHTDAMVRTAASSLAFNAAAGVQRARVATALSVDEEWQVELISALLEALQQEESEEVIHRLVAAVACLLRFMPADGQLHGLLEVLGARGIMQGKLESKLIKKKKWATR
ncbi:PPPDE putative peptidase domain-containing protein [Favolaschia claudopus]|uniref:PPPDE putative peptidase domain-containing protein n=1 Tax=Favolaschia claudopus TaxID=2862362 RepID=A0AAW0D6Q2_9AGAR